VRVRAKSNGWCFTFEFSPKLFGFLSAWKLALEKLHLALGVVPHNMVRGSSTPYTKPFLKLWIPADFWMFHGKDLYHRRQQMVCLAVTVQHPRGRESKSLGLQLLAAGDSDAVFVVDLPHKPP
jgi:hypothetical protein